MFSCDSQWEVFNGKISNALQSLSPFFTSFIHFPAWYAAVFIILFSLKLLFFYVIQTVLISTVEKLNYSSEFSFQAFNIDDALNIIRQD